MASTQILAFARASSIAWGDDTRYWSWQPADFCGYPIEEARLSAVSWFDCRWTLNTTDFKQDVSYNASIEVKLSNPSGWGPPLSVELVMPDGSKQEYQVVLEGKEQDVWFKIPVGKFLLTPCSTAGLIQFIIYQHGGHWKKGLIVRALGIEAQK